MNHNFLFHLFYTYIPMYNKPKFFVHIGIGQMKVYVTVYLT